jgi:hypothetical protein
MTSAAFHTKNMLVTAVIARGTRGGACPLSPAATGANARPLAVRCMR